MLAAALLAVLPLASAHLALWHPSMFGAEKGRNYDSEPHNPIKQVCNTGDKFCNMAGTSWFAHNYKNLPPENGAFLPITSGGQQTFEISTHPAYTKAFTKNPAVLNDPKNYWAAYGGDSGPMHTSNKVGQPIDNSRFGGTYIAIAYTSDIQKLQPGDMTVISINSTSPWQRETVYKFPAGLPKCPPGGCICTWGWNHGRVHGEGYGSEIYNIAYRCKVEGQTNDNNQVPKGQPAVKCENDQSKCVKGPKQPMYVWMNAGNNMPDPAPGEENPTYNMRYGWRDGAQNDAVVPKANAAPKLPTKQNNAPNNNNNNNNNCNTPRDYVPPQGRRSRRSTHVLQAEA